MEIGEPLEILMAFQLPEQSLSATSSRALTGADEKQTNILIVDDDEQIRNLFLSCLSERYQCLTAQDAKEALAILATKPFALVISDVQMPGLSGIELLRKIAEQYPETAVIMVSGVGRSQRVLDAIRLGAYDYLIKPCELEVFELTVERALERRKILRDGERSRRDLEERNQELAKRKAELEQLQTQMVHREKMASLGQLAAGVAHELNNPAGFIFGNMEHLRACVSGLERLLKYYDAIPLSEGVADEVLSIKREIDYDHVLADLMPIVADCSDGAGRIRDIVQNLRLFSHLDEVEFKKIDLHEGIESTIRLLSQYYGPGKLTLVRDYSQLPLVDCYAGQLNQVWMNLLTNAAQAITIEGVVRISTRTEDDQAVVSIADSGSGIDQEVLKKIFDPFFTTKRVGEGTGLGLSITYGIIERHGGTINIESRPGEGTTFHVAIPINSSRGDHKPQ